MSINTNWPCPSYSTNFAGPCWWNGGLSRSQIIPQWNVNISSRPKKRIELLSSIRERNISVQEQQQNRQAIIPQRIKCKSNHSDKCYADYNAQCLQLRFGHVRDIRYEKNELGKPTLVIHSPTLDKDENDIVILTDQVLQTLGQTELRKRYAIVHTDKYVYIIGGYIYDPDVRLRKRPRWDYKYDVTTHTLIPIQALPNGAVGFGLCTDNSRIYAVGGNDVNNRPLVDCYCMTFKDENEMWTKMPDLPAPTTSPGLGSYDDEIHCIGGFDMIGNESIAHGEYLILRYPYDKQWRHAPDLDTPRARPLVLILSDNSSEGRTIYAAGGYDVDPNTNKPIILADLQLFSESTQRWQCLTRIPDLQLSHALSFHDNKLHVSETIERPDQLPTTTILRSFDLEKLSWTAGEDTIHTNKFHETSFPSSRVDLQHPTKVKHHSKVPTIQISRPTMSSTSSSADIKQMKTPLTKTKSDKLQVKTSSTKISSKKPMTVTGVKMKSKR